MIGGYLSDVTRNFTIQFSLGSLGRRDIIYQCDAPGWENGGDGKFLSGHGFVNTNLMIEKVGIFGNETAPASISISVYVSY